MTIVEFLRARLDEDEAAAEAAKAYNGATWVTEEVLDGCRVNGTVDPGNPRAYRGDVELWDDEGALGMFRETAEHVARHDPARVLREVEAKRRIVDEHRVADWDIQGHETCETCVSPDDWNVTKLPAHLIYPCKTLRYLAAIYADHPDYRREWVL